ncbi:MAG: hypothetical protein V3W41_12825 [Planctomycetota bacterium]
MSNAQKARQSLIDLAKQEVIDLYESLACSDWTSDDCTPQELEDAVDELRNLHDQPCVGDYSEAVDWASYLVSKRDLGTDEGAPINPGALAIHEENADIVLFREDDVGDPKTTAEERAGDYNDECAYGQRPVACLDTFRTFGYVVEHKGTRV